MFSRLPVTLLVAATVGVVAVVPPAAAAAAGTAPPSFVTTTALLPGETIAVAVDDSAGAAWAVSSEGVDSNTLTEVDLATGSIAASIPLPGIPEAVAVSGGSGLIFVVTAVPGDLLVIDASTGAIQQTVGLSSGPPVGGATLAVDPVTDAVYISADVDFFRYDPTGDVLTPLALPGIQVPEHSLFDPVTRSWYISDSGAEAVWTYDTVSGAAPQAAGLSFTPGPLAADTATARGFVGAEDGVGVFDLDDPGLETTWAVPSAAGVAFDSARRWLYAAAEGVASVSIVDPDTGTVAGTIPLPRATTAGLGVDPDTGAVVIGAGAALVIATPLSVVPVPQPGGAQGDVLYLVPTADSPPQVVIVPSAETALPFGTGWQRPLSITVDPRGTVWVLDSDGTGQRIVRLDAAGGNQETFVTGLAGATSIASDSAGDLYVATQQMGGVIEFPTGSTQWSTVPAFEFLQSGGPVGPLAVSPTGALAVISAGTVFVAREGSVMALTAGATVAFDGGGSLYIGVDGGIVVRGENGEGPPQPVLADWPSATMAFTAGSVGYIASGQTDSFVLRYSGGAFTEYLSDQPGTGWAAAAVSPPAVAATAGGPGQPGPQQPGDGAAASGSTRVLAASGVDPVPVASVGTALLLAGVIALRLRVRGRARG